MTQTWNKYTWVCSICDALHEITSTQIIPACFEGLCSDKECGGPLTLLSVVDATIQPINQTKEEKMEETTMNNLPLSEAEKYNPNQLVTYKIIHGYSDPEYATAKVSSLEWDLHNGRQNGKIASALQSKISTAKSILIEAFADSEDQDTLKDIAEALGIELTKDISWEATIVVSGTMTVNLTDEFDFESELTDSLFVDSQNGDIQIDSYDVDTVREN